MIEVTLNWADPEDRGGLFQEGVEFSEVPRAGDEVIFDYGDADPPHDGYLSGVVQNLTWWGDGKVWVNLKLEIADPWPFEKRKTDGD